MRILATALLIVLASVLDASAVVRVDDVKVERDEVGFVLRVTTDRPANFTSYKLDRPSRVIVEFPEATATAAQDDDAPGPFGRWQLEAYDEPSALVRLTIELESEADYLLDSSGREVRVRLVPAAARPIAALERSTPPSAEKPAPAPEFALPPEREVVPPAPLAVAGPEPGEASSPSASPPVLADGEIEAHGEPDEVLVAEEVKAQVEPDEVFVAAEVVTSDEPDEVRVAAEVETSDEPEEVIVEAAPVPERAVVAKDGPPPQRRPPPKQKSVALSHLAFRVTGAGPRVTVRTSGPVGYSISEDAPTRLVVTLHPAHIPVPTNRLPLDTRFFSTVVQGVRPVEQDGRVRLEIELAEPAAYRTHQEEGVLSIEFVDTPSSVLFPSSSGVAGAP